MAAPGAQSVRKLIAAFSQERRPRRRPPCHVVLGRRALLCASGRAGELLMPEFLFAPRIQKQIPSLSRIDALAEEFVTSNLATAMQFINYTREPCALVVIKNGKINKLAAAEEIIIKHPSRYRMENRTHHFEFWVR